MCRSTVGSVMAILDGEVIVELEGVLRRASSLLVPELQVGDQVLVGLGSVLGVVDADDRAALADLAAVASRSRPLPDHEPDPDPSAHTSNLREAPR
jgi:hydrogenase maturation factor